MIHLLFQQERYESGAKIGSHFRRPKVNLLFSTTPLKPNEQDLKILTSTRRLLRILKKCDKVQFDATYKIVWQRYPVMLVDTSDKCKVFYSIAFAMCKGESSDDFIFQKLRNYDLSWSPSLLLVNENEAITTGFQNEFDTSCTFLFHALKNVEKYFRLLPTNGTSITLYKHAKMKKYFWKLPHYFYRNPGKPNTTRCPNLSNTSVLSGSKSSFTSLKEQQLVIPPQIMISNQQTPYLRESIL